MGNVDKRIEALERLYGMDASEGSAEESERAEREQADFMQRLERVRERAREEEEAGDPRRRLALENLEEALRRRCEGSAS